jgi:uncharacterized protein (UPF0332 family)
MDGRRLHTLAQKLLEGGAAQSPLTAGDGAPECRSAISRAYYAAFLVASAYLDRIGFAVENTPAAHVAVQHALNNSGDAALRGVASDLRDLPSERRRADYDVKDLYPERLLNAERIVNLAASVITRLDDVRDNAAPDRTGAIAVAVSNWLRSAQTAGLRQKSGTG